MSGRDRRSLILLRNPVDDGEARIDARAVARIDAAIHACREHEGRADGKIGIERLDVGVRRIVSFAGENHKPSAVRQAAQRRADMAHGGVAHGALDAGRGRKRRVHQDSSGLDRGVEIIVDLLGVELRDRRLREQARKQRMARFGQLVQGKFGARDLGMDGEKAGSGRRFEHKLAWRHLRRNRHQKSEAERRRKLLKLVAFLGPARMGGQQRRNASRSSRARGRDRQLF